MTTSSKSIPENGWDTHCHVFDPIRHPYISNTPYRPPARTVNDLQNASLTRNVVIVMALPEGTNPAHTVEAIAAFKAAGRDARGTVVLDLHQMDVDNLKALDAAGIRSVRLHQTRLGEGGDLGGMMAAMCDKFAIAGVKWSLDAQLSLATWVRLSPVLRNLHNKYGTVFVIDHMACCHPSDVDSPDFSHLLDLLREGVVYIKISAMDRYRADGPVEAFESLIRQLVETRWGEGLLFGSDWPHTVTEGEVEDLPKVDLGPHIRLIKSVCDSVGQGLWEKVWQSNAADLYK
ncbi:hypothetical protein M231_03993 [Tremella mesenterica]|uniref:Amidohydrolase-related domain-containing protein n=1 Tax=Tremella mesenterica TaxID=5217 RepID=A0A4Q1BLL7_TREME|nr:uncharacterized protein TREMEDRAFT_72072 [Tremella mesenterica DSM 1558]EIW67965.1 hypothetical protein TREMEDRAFT_72072 [Tremella mesenterica DSM 1558]RXK38683.1 hypothetical protein M231_03993 [Tremella mesenterica]